MTGTIDTDALRLKFRAGVLEQVGWSQMPWTAACRREDVRTAMTDAEAHRSRLYTVQALWDTYGPPEEAPADPLDADAPQADADAGEEEGITPPLT